MNSKRINHPQTPDPSPHLSAAVVSDGWVHLSGQGPLDMATRTPVRGTIEEETALTLANIEAILGQIGCSKNDVVRCTCYLATLEDFNGFNAVYKTHFTQPVPPARSTVQAGLLAGIKVEIDVIARVPQISD